MNKLQSYLLLILVLSSLLGCGSSSENEEIVEIIEPIEGRVLESNILGDSELDSLVLEGSWISECLPNGNDSSLRQWSFNGNNMAFTKREFTGLECQDSFSSTKLEGHFELGEVLTLDSGHQVNKIRYMLDTTDVIYYSADVVSQFNDIELCGLDAWQVGQYNNVTGCDAFKSASDIGNDVFLINAGTLSTGDLNTVGLNSFPAVLTETTYAYREPEVIEGEWVQGCTSYSGNNSTTKSITFSESGFTRETYFYDNVSCDTAGYSIFESGDISIGSEVVLTSGQNVTELNLTIESQKLAAQTDFYVYAFRGFCDIDDWVISAYREISGCSSFETGKMIKDIFSIEEDRLYFGQGSTIGGLFYPTELNEAFFTR